MTTPSKAWADEEFEEITEETDYETTPDESGIKLSYQFKTNGDGRRVKITKKILVQKTEKKVHRRVVERKKGWKKFGKVAGVEGIEPGASYRGDDVCLVLGEHEKMERERQEQEKKDKKELEELYNSLIVEGKRPVTMGGPTAPWRPLTRVAPTSTPTVGRGGGTPSADVYVPPHKNRPFGSPEATDEETTTTLRVTNLSDETTENDLLEMFRDYGVVTRVYLVKDKETNVSRGFAFVTFANRRDAQAAMDKLNGYGWNHLILSIEWAKPSIK